MAVAFDTSTRSGTGASGTGFSWSHTCTGADRLLVVHVTKDGAADQVTGVTYNSVAMTQLTTFTFSSSRIYMYYLYAPATGANNISVSTSASGAYQTEAASYTGVGPSQDSSNSGNSTGTSMTGSDTTAADNCWLVMGVTNETNTETMVAGTGTTVRQNAANQGFTKASAIMDSNAAKTPAGSYSLGCSWTTNVAYGYIIMAIRPRNDNTVALAQGSFTLTGNVLNILRAHIVALAQGAYTFTGNAVNFVLTLKWNNSTASTSSMTNGTKNTSSWSNQTENTSTMTNQTKN